jgi:hypothetical protein
MAQKISFHLTLRLPAKTKGAGRLRTRLNPVANTGLGSVRALIEMKI